MEKKKQKTKKKYKIVNTRWWVSPPEAELSFSCPGCGVNLDMCSFKEYIEEGSKVNKLVTCRKCRCKFKLVVEEVFL